MKSYSPPKPVREAALRGLEWRRQHKRGGTAIGVARARDLSNGRKVSPATIKRMQSYFARHAVDKKAPGFRSTRQPSAGRIAWDLWGGEAGRKWARSIEV